MHDPEQFQRETIKAITDFHHLAGQLLSRQLAQQAVLRALVAHLPLPLLEKVQAEFEAEVDHQVTKLDPKFQRPEFWQEWEALIEDRRQQLAAGGPPQTGSS